MTGYSVEIKETSRELTAKQRIALKDTSDAIKLDTACDENAVIIDPVDYAVLAIHNEKSDNVDYENYVIIDKNGDKYVTGSASFWSSFMDIYSEMQGEDEDWSIKSYKLDSKNYKGKKFLTCSIIQVIIILEQTSRFKTQRFILNLQKWGTNYGKEK